MGRVVYYNGAYWLVSGKPDLAQLPRYVGIHQGTALTGRVLVIRRYSR
jgi:hypothetical protein